MYDFAGILSPDAIVRAEAVIDGIEARTGAEVVVYTQPTGYYGVETSETESRARALIDQWGIGRAGFNDGMVIFFDIDPSLEHGQVQLYAAPGFEAAFLSNAERQSIFENDMVPLLRNADFDGALEVALRRVDDAATPEHAAELERARQVNAVLGLVGAPVALLGLSGWAFLNWRRFGKDPVYLDDPSILMPAPPPDLTAASGAMVMDGATSRRALTTAMLDLASRGSLSFREEKGLLGLSHKVGVDMSPVKGDDLEEAHRARNARRPLGPAEELALKKLHALGADQDGNYLTPEELPKFGPYVDDFNKALEGHVVKRGWFTEAPSKVTMRWAGKGTLAIVAGVIALIAGWTIPISGLVLIGIGVIGGGHRHPVLRQGDAVRHDAGCHDPGDARGVPAHAREDDGAGALDAAGRRRSRTRAGSRRRTRPWSGARRWVSSTRSRASSAEASTRSRRPVHRPRLSGSRPGIDRPTARRSPAEPRPAAAVACSRTPACPTSAA